MNIFPLYQVPQYAEQVTEWLWTAFGDPQSRDFFASIVAVSQQQDKMPLTFVALDGDALLGTAGLWRCDLISRQDLWPWLAALYVDESQRGRGVGEKLQEYVIDYSRSIGFKHLYLYSACKGYYERFNWQYIGDGLDYLNQRVHLYQQKLG